VTQVMGMQGNMIVHAGIGADSEDSPWWWETGTRKFNFIHSGCFVALSTHRSSSQGISEGW
jgi:hypothetical protein